MQQLFHWAVLALKISVIGQVFAIGLATSWQDATSFFRRPSLLWKSILARNVIVPIVAFLLIKAFSLRGPVAIAIGVLSVTPVPPLLPISQLKSSRDCEYTIGLVVSQAVLAIVIVPVTIRVLAMALGSQARFGPRQVGQVMMTAVLIPLAVGMLVAKCLPGIKKLVRPLLTVGSVMLIAGIVFLLPLAWKAFHALSGNGTMLALAIFILAGTAAGHFLGGPSEENRTTLAIATAARHPGLAIAIAAANFPEQRQWVSGVVVIYVLLRVILSIPYVRSRRLAQTF